MLRSTSPTTSGGGSDMDGGRKGFPPYPAYVNPAPPSVAETVAAGHGLRQQHKSKPRKSIRPLPKPAKPRSPKATDVKMSYHAMKAQARCLRRHGGMLSDRLERMAKPRRRTIIYFWRDNANTLPADTISRLRSMLDADEPFKPDQAYAYFVNLKKSKKKAAGASGLCGGKKDLMAMCNDKNYVWARHATVAFAKGIQLRLGKPGRFALADGMLRLSNNILRDICGIMKMKTPSRRSKKPKAKFMMEMSDKIAVWIDEILSESDDRMLMMDVDEDDEEVESFFISEGKNKDGTKKTGKDKGSRDVSPSGSPPGAATPAATPRSTPSTTPGSKSPITSPPRSSPTNTSGVQTPKSPSRTSTNTKSKDVLLAERGGGLYGDDDDDGGSSGASGAGGPRGKRFAYMKFEGNMKKSFGILTDAMVEKGAENLLTVGKFDQTYENAAMELKRATDLKATDFSAGEGEKIYDKLDELTKDKTPPELGTAKIDVLEICTNYLAQNAEHNKDKGPAFKLLVSELNKQPNVKMYEKGKIQRTNAEAAKELEKAKGLESNHDDPTLTGTIFEAMKKLVSRATPKELKTEMNETVDTCSKYLSQKTIDDLERGPAFDLLIKVLEKQGDTHFTDFPALTTTAAAGYVLKSAPGLGSSKPNPSKVGVFQKALHKAVDSSTPEEMTEDMNNVIILCSSYLSAFIRDRTLAMECLLGMMKGSPSTVFAKRKEYEMDYKIAGDEIESAPTLIPYLPVKDIADEGKANLTRDMKGLTPPELTVAMKSLIDDASKHLSQLVAMRSGAAGERYKMNFVSAVTHSLGARPLFKYKTYAKTYGDASDELQNVDSTEPQDLDKPAETLGHEIESELKRGMPMKLAPTVVQDTSPTVDVAAMHLAKIGVEKGEAMDYVVSLMKDKGDQNLAKLQGYDQTYADGARRLENTSTLHNSTVDMKAYADVKDKLTDMTKENPDERYEQVLPEVIEDSANYLAKPVPETNAEKKQVLADLLGRKGSEIIGEKEAYKMTYREGGKDLRNAPVGVTKAYDEEKKEEMVKQITAVIPDKKMETILEESTKEGAAYLTDAIEGRGQALEVLEGNLKKEGPKEFIDVGDYKKDHTQVAEMLVTAPHLKSDKPSPVILENVEYHLDVLPKETPMGKPMAEQHMKSMTDIAAQYIAAEATKECGLDAEQLAALDAAGFNADAKALAEQRRLAAMAAGPGGGGLKIKITESYKDRVARLAAEEEARKLAEEERRKLAAEDAEKLRRAREKYRGRALGADYDLEHLGALDILHEELQAHAPEIFYEQPQTMLTHGKASDWLIDPDPMKVDKSVRDSNDTARLHKKFERKLSVLVKNKTPAHLNDAMQDVIIEAARKTAEFFVVSHFKALVKDGLVSAMQNRGNEILVEVDGAAETHFFAAQRIKRKDPDAVREPCYQVANEIEKKLDDVVRSRPMPKKLSITMRENVKESSKYLSAVATKPDDYIEAYVALLAEMEAAGDAVLVEGDVPKTAKESANYLRTLTTFKDNIIRPNRPLQTGIENKLKNMMAHVPATGRMNTVAVMNSVITDAASLLVSYVMFQAAKAEALDLLVKEMKEAGDVALLRHGPIRKSFKEGADLLDGKTTDELHVRNADPVVARKIQIKLNNMMMLATPAKFEELMNEVIAEATMFLATHFMEPKVFKVCKCYKNVFVQCELWCDEILRRVARPCCTCSRHVSAQALADLAPADFLATNPDQSHVLAPGVEISFKSCPNQARLPKGVPLPLCPGVPQTTSYLLYETTHKIYSSKDIAAQPQPSPSLTPSTSNSDSYTPKSPLSSESPLTTMKPSSPLKPVLHDIQADNPQFVRKQQEQLIAYTLEESQSPSFSSTSSLEFEASSSHSEPSRERSQQMSSKISQAKSGYSSRTPITSPEHIVDWDSTMVSLLWNVLAWRDWIQEIVDHAIAYQYTNIGRGETSVSSWLSFYRRVSTEALQWRQYSVFSRQLTNRLHLRYRDKEIVSPKRSTVQTKTYIECQEAMLEIIEMFNRWTQWLTLVAKETDALQQIPGSEIPLHEMRWNHLKMKVEGYSKDWVNYNKFLKVSWEKKYSAIIADYLPSWKKPGPVWVVSASGAVPSGAVAAGVCDGEVIWVARTMHRCTVLPATLLPSKHCCLVYAEGQVHSYSKYQVMCNAEVRWLAWRGSSITERAVSVAPGMYVGRVHYHGDHLLGAVYEPEYHCHVVIFDRPFAFNCYELLMVAGDDD